MFTRIHLNGPAYIDVDDDRDEVIARYDKLLTTRQTAGLLTVTKRNMDDPIYVRISSINYIETVR